MVDTVKDALVKAKAKIATMETWCQGVLAKALSSSPGLFKDTEPDDPMACQWCLDGALQSVFGGRENLSYKHHDPKPRELYGQATAHMRSCANKHFQVKDWVAVNDGDYGLHDEIEQDSEEGRLKAFENAHRILDCAIANADTRIDPLSV